VFLLTHMSLQSSDTHVTLTSRRSNSLDIHVCTEVLLLQTCHAGHAHMCLKSRRSVSLDIHVYTEVLLLYTCHASHGTHAICHAACVNESRDISYVTHPNLSSEDLPALEPCAKVFLLLFEDTFFQLAPCVCVCVCV